MTTYSFTLPRKKRARTHQPQRDWLFVGAIGVLAAVVLLAVVASVIPFAGEPSKLVAGRLQAPSLGLPLGSDALGRSLAARLLEGIATTLVVSAIAVLLTAAISVALGLIAGYRGGMTREIIMRVVDVLYSFPSIVLAILVAAMLGPGQIAALASIILVTVPLMTRMVSTAAAAVAERDFVTTARISGVAAPMILVRHVLPNISGTIAVQGTYALSVGILVEGGLSFLGYGVQPPHSSLGLLIQEGSAYMTQAPWLLFAPGMVLVLAILAINVIGDTLRDRLDPREPRSLV